MTEVTIDQIIAIIKFREKEAYEKGWQDAVASIMKAARQGVPYAQQTLPGLRQHSSASGAGGAGHVILERPIVAVIEDIIKEQPGLRGADIFREAVKRVPGSEFKTMDRSGRTALGRLKNRGKIRMQKKRWYPAGEVDQPNITPKTTEEKN